MAAMQTVVAARGDRPFTDLVDFASRIDPKHLNRMQVENLVRAGAFDKLVPKENRKRAFDAAELVLRRALAAAQERESGQQALFGATDSRDNGSGTIRKQSAVPNDAWKRRMDELGVPDLPDWDPMDRLAFEAEAIGFHLTSHPLDAYGAALRRLGVVASNQLESRAQSGPARVKIAGSVIGEQGTNYPHRQPHGLGPPVRLPAVPTRLPASPKCWPARASLLTAGASLLVTADIRLEGEALRITAHDVAPLDAAACAGRRRAARLAADKPRRCRISARCSNARDAAAAASCWCRGSTPSRMSKSSCRAASMFRRVWRRR